MLVRFVVENMLSFDERKEFNMLPYKRLQTLNHHKMPKQGMELLKLASLYGANGAGKSNLVKILNIMQQFVLNKETIAAITNRNFKWNTGKNAKSQFLAIEFIQDEKAFYYALLLGEERVAVEELYESGLGEHEDRFIFERKTDKQGNTNLRFMDEFEREEKNQILKSVLLEEFIEADKPLLKLLAQRDNNYLQVVKKALAWFSQTLQVIDPAIKPQALAQRIEEDEAFKTYAEELMCAYNVGVDNIYTEKVALDEFFGEENRENINELKRKVENAPKKMIGLRSRKGNEIILLKENDNIVVKQIKISHKGKQQSSLPFELEEESDGTIRLLDFIPAFHDITLTPKVYVVDEIERSIHPLLIKELLRKFSKDQNNSGQLIFTTHESNLLDQDIFRQDEIWFAEKDESAATDLYALSAFKEHKTIDIRKGYLNGRYGSIPFLGNLQDLNWHEYAFD